MANSVRISASVDDKVSGPLDRIRDRFDQLGKGAASASLVGNAGAMALAHGIGLAGVAISKVTDFIGDSVTAFRQEEASIALLTAALEANVPAWDGNSAAIERVLAEREKLGFADDAQREGLKILLAATNDVSAALDAQVVAMDLARFRGIDLSTASDMVAKAFDGNGMALKRLGIDLGEGVKGYDALTAITKVAGGQAEKFATTDLGKVEVAQRKVDNAMERVGQVFSQVGAVVMPVVAQALEVVVDVAGKVGEVLGEVARIAGPILSPALQGLSVLFSGLGSVAGSVASGISGAFNAVVGVVRAVVNSIIRAWNGLNFTFPRIDLPFGGTFGGFTIGTPNIPYLHQGGIVPGAAGSDVLAMLQAGERVLPVSEANSSGGGSPVVIYLQLDGRTVAEVTDRNLYYRTGQRGLLPA